MKKICIFVALMVIMPLSFAEKDKTVGSGPNPFSDCGIGAALFPSTKWAAVTSNVIWDVGTTALTSAVSSPETCNGKQVETAQLIIETLPALEKDIALGKGKYLTALSDIVECDVAAQADFTATLRRTYLMTTAADDYGVDGKIQRASDLYRAVQSSIAENNTVCHAQI